MLAAERATPCWQTAGMVIPIGVSAMLSANASAICSTTTATDSGVAGDGVSIRTRSAVSSPVARSTGAPLTPLPPMSIPRTGRGRVLHSSICPPSRSP